jgi:copper(I)-binding protein
MKSIILTTVAATVLAAILILGGTAAFTNLQKVNAQMSAGNMTGGMMGMKAGGAGPNITGSIKMSTVIGNALSSQIKVGLNQSAMTAEKAVGNNSHAVAAHIGVQNGYLVYTVWVIDPNMKFNRVIVDAGNGKVLSNQPISQGESMMIHGMMMGGGGMMMQHGPGGMMMRGGGYSAGGSHGMMMGGPGMGKPWP